jgi:hypothetical protein
MPLPTVAQNRVAVLRTREDSTAARHQFAELQAPTSPVAASATRRSWGGLVGRHTSNSTVHGLWVFPTDNSSVLKYAARVSTRFTEVTNPVDLCRSRPPGAFALPPLPC